ALQTVEVDLVLVVAVLRCEHVHISPSHSMVDIQKLCARFHGCRCRVRHQGSCRVVHEYNDNRVGLLDDQECGPKSPVGAVIPSTCSWPDTAESPAHGKD